MSAVSQISELQSRIVWALDDGPCDTATLKERIGEKYLPTHATALFAELRGPTLSKIIKQVPREDGAGWLYELHTSLTEADLLRMGFYKPSDEPWSALRAKKDRTPAQVAPATDAPPESTGAASSPVCASPVKDADVEKAFAASPRQPEAFIQTYVPPRPLRTPSVIQPGKPVTKKIVVREFVPAQDELAIEIVGKDEDIVVVQPFPIQELPGVIGVLMDLARERGLKYPTLSEDVVKPKRTLDRSAFKKRVADSVADGVLTTARLLPMRLAKVYDELARAGVGIGGATMAARIGQLRSILQEDPRFYVYEDEGWYVNWNSSSTPG